MPSFTRNGQHLAEECPDFGECPRFPCVMFFRGYTAAAAREYARGYADGEAAGYLSGYSAAAASSGSG